MDDRTIFGFDDEGWIGADGGDAIERRPPGRENDVAVGQPGPARIVVPVG
jgi:hypothetical protein